MNVLRAFRWIGWIRAWYCLWMLVPFAPAFGDDLELRWAKVINEGEISGGDFSVVGQPAPAEWGRMQGGDFALGEGGSGSMVTAWETLGIEKENGTNKVYWTSLASDWRLETNSAVGAGSWGAVPSGEWTVEGRLLIYRVAVGGSPCFFRLVKPEPPER